MSCLNRRLPKDLTGYSLHYGVDERDSHIVSLGAWVRGGRLISSYPVLDRDQAGYFNPVRFEEAVVNAIADMRAHQRSLR